MTDLANFLQTGLVGHDVGLLLSRVILGTFFVLARFRWFYDPSRPEHWLNQARHTHLSEKLAICGFGNRPHLASIVATIEVGAGLFLILGLLTSLAGGALIAILLAATSCTAKEKTLKQGPVDKIDVACDYLWTVEPVYLTLAVIAFLCGGGAYGLDSLFNAVDALKLSVVIVLVAVFILGVIDIVKHSDKETP